MNKVNCSFVYFLGLIGLLLMISACRNPNTSMGDNQGSSITYDYDENKSARNIAEDDSAAISFTNKLYLNLTDITVSTDNSNWTTVTSESMTVFTDSSGKEITASFNNTTKEVLISSSKSSETLQIIVTGSSDKVHLFVENKKEVEI